MDRKTIIADTGVFLLRLLLPALALLWIAPVLYIIVSLTDPVAAAVRTGWLPEAEADGCRRLCMMLSGLFRSLYAGVPQILTSLGGILLGYRVRGVRSPLLIFLPALLPVALLIPSSLLFGPLFQGTGLVGDAIGAFLASFLFYSAIVRFADRPDPLTLALAVFFTILLQPRTGQFLTIEQGGVDVIGGLSAAGASVIAALPGALLALLVLRRSARIRFLN